jgi:hypothetical protein
MQLGAFSVSRSILTFNPGWDSNARHLATFTDARELQRQLQAQGVELQSEADESTTGPARRWPSTPCSSATRTMCTAWPT